MYSLREMGVMVVAAALTVESAIRVIQMVARWFGFSCQWWQAALGLTACGVLLIAIVGAGGYLKRARQEYLRQKIEKRYPAARATLLSNGSWLLTDIATGHTVREIPAMSVFVERDR